MQELSSRQVHEDAGCHPVFPPRCDRCSASVSRRVGAWKLGWHQGLLCFRHCCLHAPLDAASFEACPQAGGDTAVSIVLLMLLTLASKQMFAFWSCASHSLPQSRVLLSFRRLGAIEFASKHCRGWAHPNRCLQMLSLRLSNCTKKTRRHCSHVVGRKHCSSKLQAQKTSSKAPFGTRSSGLRRPIQTVVCFPTSISLRAGRRSASRCSGHDILLL